MLFLLNVEKKLTQVILNIPMLLVIRGEAIEHALKTMEEELGFKVKIDWTHSYNERKVCVYQAHISW